MQTLEFRGVCLTDIPRAELTRLVVLRLRQNEGLTVSFVNPHSFNLLGLASSGSYQAQLRDFDIVCADGIGVCWAVKMLMGKTIERISFDLWAPHLLSELARERARVFLFGAKPGVAEAAAAAMSRSHPGLNVVGTHHGYVEDELVEPSSSISRSRAHVVIVGAGAPKQEHLVFELRKSLPELILTCGGYLDQVSQPTPYYPRWAYPLRLNWVVRLWREPKRLWRRYLIGNPQFVAESVAWRIRGSPNVDACSRRSLGPPDN